MTTDLSERNRHFYRDLWSSTRLHPAENHNTWPFLAPVAARAARRLEIGPGMRPRLPASGGFFVDQDPSAVTMLRAAGGRAVLGDIRALPFADGAFDLAGAFDVVEHVSDDGRVFAELSRVLRAGGRLAISVPLHGRLFTEFDALVGHHRRYEPPELIARLTEAGLTVEHSARYGMQPRSALLERLGVWWLKNHRATALRWWDRACGLAIRHQKPLRWVEGMIDAADADEVVMLCLKGMR